MFGQRLAVSRKQRGWKQIDLAVALGVQSQSMISEVESGRKKLSFERIVTAAQELRVSTDYLAGLTDDPRPAAELAARCADLERRLAAGARRQ